MNIDPDKLARDGLGYRYVLFDADGQAIGPGGLYEQRPKALSRADALGCGVFDAREGEALKTANVPARLDKWKQTVEALEDELATARTKVAVIEREARANV